MFLTRRIYINEVQRLQEPAFRRFKEDYEI